MILSPGARIAPGGRMKQLLGAVVWNLKATWDLLVFLILIALLACFPGSSSPEKVKGQETLEYVISTIIWEY